MDVLVKALGLVAIVATGYATKRLGWAKTSDFGLFAKIVLRITLPCALVTSFNDYHMPFGMLALALVGVVANLVLQVAAYWMGRPGGGTAQAFAVINVASFNLGAFAMPYLAGFMGSGVIVLASLFDIGNALCAAGFGYAWAMHLVGGREGATVLRFLKAMFSSVVFDVYLALVLMKLFDLRLPSPVIQFTSTVGAANTFLAMLMIGIGLEVRLDRGRYHAAFRFLALRYLVVALIAVAVWFAPMPQQYRLLVVIILFAPIASMAPGFTDEAGGDVRLSAFMTSISIVVGIVAMPLLLVLLG